MNYEDMNLIQVKERRDALKVEKRAMLTAAEVEIKDMTIAADVEARTATIVADVAKVDKEDRELETREKELTNLETRKQTALDITAGKIAPTVIESRKEMKQMDKILTPEMPEYRSAYFKTLAGEQLTEIEQRAFTATTANFGGALPITTLNEIWSNIEEEHPILGDIDLRRTGTIMEVSLHTAIAAGDAAVVAEGVANNDEENTFIKVTLSGKDFSKSVEISYALGLMTAPALETYLVAEISARMGAALARDIVAQIIADTDAGNKTTSAAVKVTTFIELNGLFGLLKQAKNVVVYATRATFFKYLTSIVDTTDRPIFQTSMQDGSLGNLLGSLVKIEDAVADNVFLIGAPKQVVGNMIQDIMIESDKDIKRHVNIYAGYARFECKLKNSLSFAVFTMKQA